MGRLHFFSFLLGKILWFLACKLGQIHLIVVIFSFRYYLQYYILLHWLKALKESQRHKWHKRPGPSLTSVGSRESEWVNKKNSFPPVQKTNRPTKNIDLNFKFYVNINFSTEHQQVNYCTLNPINYGYT